MRVTFLNNNRNLFILFHFFQLFFLVLHALYVYTLSELICV
jgi:hypothetical protein